MRAVHLGLKPIGHNPQQEVFRQVRWRPPAEHAAPAGLEAREVETAQPRDLIIEFWCPLAPRHQPVFDGPEAAGALLIR